MCVCDTCPLDVLPECPLGKEKGRSYCPHAHALGKAKQDLVGGRLVWVPWQAGGMVLPRFQEERE